MRLLALLLIAALALPAAEADALALSAHIQARHLPFGTLLDPFYASPSSPEITGYTRCGDSAIWTGHYLAAEAFRFRVTRSPDALANASRTLAALTGLVDVTGNDSLARCRIPLDSPFRPGIEREEAANGVFRNPALNASWIGNTSRDQYLGVFFGLSLAYEHIPSLQPAIRPLATRLANHLLSDNWAPFLLRPDHILTILIIARQIHPERFAPIYAEHRTRLADSVSLPVAFDSLSTSSYFKFNLIYTSFYSLVRLEDSPAKATYLSAYAIARRYTAGHQNAFFNLIDHALTAPDPRRDAEALELLDLWLKRPRRDFYVDRANEVPVCNNQACEPLPVDRRVPTDFLWQRNPFQLAGGGAGTIGNAGVDYILPYWMARYYGLLPSLGVNPTVAPDSLISLYGPLSAAPRVEIQGRPATLFYTSPTQLNLLVPPETALGPTRIRVLSDGPILTAETRVDPVSPSLYTLNAAGLAAATADTGPVFACVPQCQPVPLPVPAALSLYATGLRQGSRTTATVGGLAVPVLYSGPQPTFPGLDQVNLALPVELRGRGAVEIQLTVDGVRANPATITVR
jgi:uncharacterized protein (TIGR03437 family)